MPTERQHTIRQLKQIRRSIESITEELNQLDSAEDVAAFRERERAKWPRAFKEHMEDRLGPTEQVDIEKIVSFLYSRQLRIKEKATKVENIWNRGTYESDFLGGKDDRPWKHDKRCQEIYEETQEALQEARSALDSLFNRVNTVREAEDVDLPVDP